MKCQDLGHFTGASSLIAISVYEWSVHLCKCLHLSCQVELSHFVLYLHKAVEQ